jgi:hypothetical protein
MTALLWLAGASVLLLGGCMEPIVLGHIPPSTFHFTNVVPHDGKGPSGWKVAQVVILLGRLSTHYPETASCDVEVGVPEETMRRGRISDAMAQRAAAKAADAAAREVLAKHLPTGAACMELLNKMEAFLIDPKKGGITGAQVTRFQRAGVPRNTFP